VGSGSEDLWARVVGSGFGMKDASMPQNRLNYRDEVNSQSEILCQAREYQTPSVFGRRSSTKTT
jgi:hypothetical protein